MDRDRLREVLTAYTAPRPGHGRSASVTETAALVANVRVVARVVGPDDPVARLAMAKADRTEAQVRAGPQGDRYDRIRPAAVQVRGMDRRGVRRRSRSSPAARQVGGTPAQGGW